jgi:hypothetical protein
LGDARVRETGRYGLIASYQVQGGSIRPERRDKQREHQLPLKTLRPLKIDQRHLGA